MQRLSADLLQADTHRKLLGQQEPGVAVMADAGLADSKRAHDQQAQLFDQARERGLQEGRKNAEQEIQKRVEEIEARLMQAHKKAVAELREKQELFQKLTGNLKASIEQHASEAETVAVEVAFASVLRLLGDKAADRSLVAQLAAAVAREYGHGAATLHVSEAERLMFESANSGLVIAVDRRLQSGQCIIETTRGQFDCGLDVRLEALKKAFLSGLNEHRGQM
jgi:flagellar assembly protein FliH